MAFDFGNEEEQQEFSYGPVPSGSVVVVRMNVLSPAEGKQDPDDPLISVARSGLRQLYVQCEVDRGNYNGVQWRQTITLPIFMQHIRMSDGQSKSASIGGSTLKAILQAAGKPTKLQSLKTFDGVAFPVRVRIRNDGYESQNGEVYWRNEIAKVITPGTPEYSEVRQKGEIINPNGAVTGKEVRKASGNSAFSSAGPSESAGGWGHETAPAEELDSVPF